MKLHESMNGADDSSSVWLSREFGRSFRDDLLHLIILPTEQCNFRCLYCYEDFAIGRMRPPVIEGVKNLLNARAAGLETLVVSWFGGEPLLALRTIEEISDHIRTLRALHPGLTVSGDVTTNGYFLDIATAERLVDCGVERAQVSLDGPPEHHDLTRVRANGAGSFDRIWGNLERLLESSVQLKVLLRIHVTQSNLAAMPQFLRAVASKFGPDPRFEILLRPVERLGGPHDDELDLLPDDSRADVMAGLERVVSDGTDSTASGLFEPSELCYASRANSLVIRANGVVGKCTVALSDPANAVGELRPDGTLTIHDERVRTWMRGWESGDLAELRCPYGGMSTASEPELLEIGWRST